ncbi:hypothetical protein [Limnoglobus roseus]|uniref:NINE protein n=1 Tax=Limnoglobus roseus TaxID=2598579 RepID=A0A5C1AC01_9BACT|nr:hypothetical protein [Limnoglobus roseus]QEL16899.1 NINE protein [Limnoglobus roseus]
MIRFACPGCDSTFSVDDSKAGKSGKCPKCQTQFIIPQLEAAPAAPPEPVPPSVPVPAPAPVPVPVSVQPTPAADPNAPVEIDPCPKCQTKLSVTVGDLGNDVECPYCKTVFKSARAGTRPPAPPAPPGKKSSFETDFSSRPKSKKRDDDEDDDDRPRKRRRDDDDDDDRPSKRRRDDDDDRPSRRGRAASRRDDDDDDDRPSRRRSSRRDDDDDDDYDDRPRRRSRRPSRRGGSGQRSGAVTAAGIFTIVIGVLWLIGSAATFFGGAFITSLFGAAPRQNMDPAGRAAFDQAQTGVTAVFIGCGLVLLLIALFHIMGGIFAIQRKSAGRIIVIICGVIGLIFGLFGLYGVLSLLRLPFTPPIEAVLYQLISLALTLGYGIFSLIVMCRSDYADEFE